MSSNLFIVLALCSLAPPTSAFSHGAVPASCQEMTPGHVHAHPLDPQQSYVSVHASASSFLPGQLLTVTVRSSRDFMGFMLQARSAAGIRSTRPGSQLVGGSWIFTPPGTHALSCFSERDTITHSDKQLKRNLSFVWRAPDTPVGDVRFHITVVQSYFIYWAGVESAAVHDGSQSVWRGSETPTEEEEAMMFSLQEEKVSVFPALKANSSSKKQTNLTAVPASWTQSMKPTSGPGTLSSQETPREVKHLALELHSSVNTTNTLTSGSHSAPGSLLERSEDPVSHTMDPESSHPFMASVFSAENTEMETTTTAGMSTSPFFTLNSHASFFAPKGIGTPRKEPTLNKDPETRDTLTLKTQSLTSQVPAETGSLSQIASSTTDLQDQTSQVPLFSQVYSLKTQTSSPDLILPSKSPTYEPFQVTPITGTKPLSLKPLPLPETGAPKRSVSDPPHPRPGRLETETTETSVTPPSLLQKNWFHPERPAEPLHTSSQPQSWSGFHTERTLAPLFFTEDLESRAEVQTVTPVFGFVPSVTSSPTFPTSSLLDFPSSSGSFSSSSIVPPSGSSSLRPSKDSVLRPSFSSSSPIPKDQPRTTIDPSAPPSPSPVSTPNHLPSVHLSSTASQPSLLLFSTALTSDSSIYPLNPSLSTSSSPFISSQGSTRLNLSSPSPSTTSPGLFSVPSRSSPSNPISSASFPPSSPPSASPLSTSPSSPDRASSPSFMSPISPPHPGVSSSPLHFPRTPFTSSVKTPDSQRLVTETQHTFSYGEPNLRSSTQRATVHQNPKPFPNHRLNRGREMKPNIPNIRPKRPSSPSEAPDKEGKYPDILPRHSAWELGMLVACSAGLGMVLVVGLRYMYRKACGRWAAVTLNDRERECGRGNRGPIQVQECGDLVRVRKIRENSFVLLTEYDVLTPPGD